MALVPVTANFILNTIIGMGASGSCYLGLSTTTPGSDGTNFTEPGAGYTRALLARQNAPDVWGTINNLSVTNDTIIFFPEATSSWGTVTYFGLFTAQTGGTPYLYGALTTSVSVPANYVPIFRVGNLTISVS